MTRPLLRLRGLGVNLGLAALALVLAAALCEVVLRVVFRDVTTTPDYSSVLSRRWRAELKLNEQGFRAPDLAVAAGESAYRIVVLGDSFAFGQGIPVEARFSEVLERRLRESLPDLPFQVLNLGKPGSETDDEVQILRTVALPLRPDFVILQWYQNDLEVGGKSGRPRPLPLVPLSSLSRWLHENSILYYLGRDQWSGLQQGLGWVDSYEAYMIDRFQDPSGEAARRAAAAMEQFVGLCTDGGVPLAVILFPDLSGPGPLDFLRERVAAQLRDLDVPVVDMAPAFFAARDRRALWANRLDRHPGPAAHLLAADALWERFGDDWMAAARGRFSGSRSAERP